ncbi:related to MOSC domain protein [Cephalotrichum gorgonifer]|uniref:Related to MOSC domain protein n=1 Tax=Cephalotrichum gorgonifer TaxID=2041049 RepID=A0AAE8MSJ0_9PEZI|nr:related to MOSC domain protein [Cephalotrichum gorgonifer]
MSMGGEATSKLMFNTARIDDISQITAKDWSHPVMLDFTFDEVLAAFDRQTTIVFVVTLLSFAIPVVLIFPPVSIRITEALAETHSKLGLPSGESNLPDHQEEIPENGTPRIRSLVVYPVKSCRGVELKRAKVVNSGLQYDRMYTFARLRDRPAGNEKEGAEPVWEFISQRHFASMSRLSVDIWCPDPTKTVGKLTEKGSDESFLVLRYPWKRPGLRGAVDWLGAKLGKGWHGVPEREVLLPVACPSEQEIEDRGYTFEPVKIWKDTVTALNLEKELPDELAGFLGVKERLGLFRMSPETRREVHRCAPTKEDAGYQPIVEFQDAYPIHLMNVASVRDVEKHLPSDAVESFDVRRFRANIIITGPPPYEEDTWKSFRLKQGEASSSTDCIYHVSCRTARCKLPNVNPDTAIRHPVEPDRYLRKHRNVDEGAPLHGCLGMMLTPIFPPADNLVALESWLEVGMEIDVTERGKHVYQKQ